MGLALLLLEIRGGEKLGTTGDEKRKQQEEQEATAEEEEVEWADRKGGEEARFIDREVIFCCLVVEWKKRTEFN